MKKIDLGVIVTTLIIVTISCSLAFFAARVVGDPKDINLVAKNVAITFADTSSIASNETISPGWSNVKTFTITNNSKEDFSYNIIIKDLVNTFESINTLQYKITSDVGYNMDSYLNVIKTESSKDVVLAYNITIPKNTIQSYQIEFNYVSTEEDQSEDMGKKLGGTLAIEASDGTPEIYDKLLADNPTIKTRTDFSNTFTETNVNTLYKATEDNTDVYYFAGDARNNWVKFGGFYWRIIRTNSDGSIRLLYHGTSPDTTEGYIGTSAFNSIRTDPMYVGYMYGTSGTQASNRTNENNSTIKTFIDTWYSTSLSSYTKYLSKDAVYCSDREVSSDYTYSVTGSTFYYAAYTRLYSNNQPTYDCADSHDAFSGNNTDAKLTYPIGLMTADEITYAGGYRYTDLSYPYAWYYLNSVGESIIGTTYWWILSPYYWNGNYARSFIAIGSDTPGRLGTYSVDYEFAVRPVISINGYVLYYRGDGSATNPYEVVAEPVNTYTVSLSVNNGSGTGTVLVEEGKDATFTVTPSSGYKAELETDTCGGTLSGNTYTISNVTSAKSCSITFKSDNPFSSGTLAAKIYIDNPTRVTREKFDTTFTSNTTGTLFTATEKNVHNTTDTTVYYYAGNTTNNWVKFAGYYWRIIRTNADGSIRMLYSGTSHDTTSGYLSTTTSAFNSTYNSPKYVGYMYGNYDSSLSNARTNTNNSTIKNAIDYWYSINMTSYTKYLSTTAVYCNDRNLRSGDTYTTSTSSTFYYAPYAKVYSSYTPTYDCTEAIDAFSVDNASAKLTYPIALMTADEIMYAGGKGNNVFTSPYAWYYLNSANGSVTGSTYWWLMSPYRWISGYAHVFIVAASDNPGWFGSSYTGYGHGVRPVVSLKSCVKTSGGDGSASNPYTIEETTSGC